MHVKISIFVFTMKSVKKNYYISTPHLYLKNRTLESSKTNCGLYPYIEIQLSIRLHPRKKHSIELIIKISFLEMLFFQSLPRALI